MVHRGNIALTWNFTSSDDLPRIVESGSFLPINTPNMLRLHIADRYRTDRRLPGFFRSRMCRVPGRHDARTRHPIIDCADRDLPDMQYVPPGSERRRLRSGNTVGAFKIAPAPVTVVDTSPGRTVRRPSPAPRRGGGTPGRRRLRQLTRNLVLQQRTCNTDRREMSRPLPLGD